MATRVKALVQENSTLEYIATIDDAIDWEKSRPDVLPTADELESVALAKAEADAAGELAEADATAANVEAHARAQARYDAAREKAASELLRRKHLAHMTDWDLSRLAFVEDAEPTVWVYKHPRRRDVRNWIIQAQALLEKDPSKLADLVMEGCAVAVVAKREGLRGASEPLPTDPKTGLLTSAYLQALHDSELAAELSIALLKRMEGFASERDAAAKKN